MHDGVNEGCAEKDFANAASSVKIAAETVDHLQQMNVFNKGFPSDPSHPSGPPLPPCYIALAVDGLDGTRGHDFGVVGMDDLGIFLWVEPSGTRVD